MNADTGKQPDYHKWVLILLITLSVIRIGWLFLSPLNLHGDEAQYWAWSRSFEWGYFSKPPMIAWLIGATTTVFGNEEWAVRLASPLIHPFTAYILFRTGQFLFDARTGFYAACLYFLMPAVWLSSAIASTDVALLLFWSLALNAWAHLRETKSVKWAALLGLAIGLGFLSKYAMLFFVIALALVAVLDKKTRSAILSGNGLVAGMLAGLIALPNIAWNAANDFQTIGHTAANANIEEDRFHPVELLEFFSGQFGVFGPVTFGLLLFALFLALKGKMDKLTLLLSCFVLIPLVTICAQALISRANANWAVTSYMAGALITARLITGRAVKTGQGGIWANVALGTAMAVIAVSPTLTDGLGLANSVKRVRGWPETVDRIAAVAKAGHEGQAFSAIATDNRLTFFDLKYYGIEARTGIPIKSWLYSNYANNHAEASAPLPAGSQSDPPALIINYYKPFDEYFRQDFKRLESLGQINVALGGGKERILYLWAGYGYTPTADAR